MLWEFLAAELCLGKEIVLLGSPFSSESVVVKVLALGRMAVSICPLVFDGGKEVG